MKKKQTRHYYAVWYQYAGAISDGDVLAQFDTRAERDEFCSRINARIGYGSGEWEPVTLASVRHRFNPRAFYSCTCGECHELNGERTSADKHVFYIHERPHYRL